MAKPIRLILADDHPLIRAGIRTILAFEPDIELVAETDDTRFVECLCQEHLPDVLLLDLNMPGPPLMQTVSRLRVYCPGVRVIVLTAHDDIVYVRGAIAAGVKGYVLKDEPLDMVIQAMRVVVPGGTWFSRSVIEKLVQNVGDEHAADDPILTAVEQHIMTLIAQGWRNARIAAEVNLAEQTVRNYTSRLYNKLGVHSRAEAILWARKRGLGEV